jgi:DNA-binding MarR family transcriptional regulator
LLSIVPDGGARVTDLARTAGMTKQALGQYVAMLEPLGYVTSTPDPTDKRVRIISRTDLGDRAVRTSNELMAAIEDEWRSLVGARRWATTRAVMLELAVGWDARD